jgi:hypothetical protein
MHQNASYGPSMTAALVFYAAALGGCLFLLFGRGWERPERQIVETEAERHRRHVETAVAQAETARTFTPARRQA